MHSFKSKGIALFLAICMVLTFVPMAFAEEIPAVTEEYSLHQAALAGGEYQITQMIDIVDGPIVVEKDLTLYLGADLQVMNSDPEHQLESVFVVRGATLTIKAGVDGNAACISYQGDGCIAKLIGAEAQTAIVSEAGSWYGLNQFSEGQTLNPDAVFMVEHPEGTLQPGITLTGGYYQTQTPEGPWSGPLFGGDAAQVSISGGGFGVDVTPYLGEGLICLNDWGSYKVYPIATEFSEDFTLTGKDGVLKLKRYAPTPEDMDYFVDMLYMTYGYPDPEGPQQYAFFGDSYDAESQTMYVSRTGEYGELLEVHRITFEFVYDEAIKAQVNSFLETLPPPDYFPPEDDWGEGWYEPHYYQVNDLELINYWLTCTEENEEYNINNLINYSKEFKEYINYKNFRLDGLDARMGDGDFFMTQTAGIANFVYGDTVYCSTEMGVRADHIFYVPTETADEDVLAAIQGRIDAYLGEGKVTVEEGGPVLDYLLQEEYNLGIAWGDIDPEMSYEDWKNSGLAPDYTAAEVTGLEWLKDTDFCFKTTINGFTYTFLAVKDSTKIVEAPIYQSVDATTEVAVRTEDASVPLDTMIQVEKLTEGEVYEHIMNVLQVEEHETYDIGLHSGSKGQVTELENGMFEVEIPLDEKFEGKDLIVYYVAEDGTVTSHDVTPLDGAISFTTDHFSAYTLTTPVELPGDGGEKHDYIWSDETKSYLCECGEKYKLTLDLDGDGSATTADTIQLLRTIDKVGDLPGFKADISKDGKVSVFDAVRHLQYMNIYGDEEIGDASVLHNKKIIFIGNSFTYYGKTVLEKAQTKLTQDERDNDKGFFYQICKENGVDVDVTNWTFGGHTLEWLFGGNCAADRGCDGVDHASYLTDRNYDYVVIQEGSRHQDSFEWVEKVMEFFREANPNVKFVYLEYSNAHFNEYPRIHNLDYLRNQGVTVVDWGELVVDVINGETAVPGATQTYNKNTFIVSKSATDGYHPNMLTGYITTMMTFSAITGLKVEGQPYDFCDDTTINKNFSFEKYAETYYAYSPSNYYDVYKSKSDMKGLQILMDRYLAK